MHWSKKCLLLLLGQFFSKEANYSIVYIISSSQISSHILGAFIGLSSSSLSQTSVSDSSVVFWIAVRQLPLSRAVLFSLLVACGPTAPTTEPGSSPLPSTTPPSTKNGKRQGKKGERERDLRLMDLALQVGELAHHEWPYQDHARETAPSVARVGNAWWLDTPCLSDWNVLLHWTHSWVAQLG